jgi:G3E family GTPase
MESMFLSFENRCLGYGESSTRKIPLLLVTGFLGAGKTTLLRHLLQNKANLKLAILVNEIAEIDIDGLLLNSAENNAGLGICTRELSHGCVCCSASDDLRAAVRTILDRRDIVVIRCFIHMPFISRHFVTVSETLNQ